MQQGFWTFQSELTGVLNATGQQFGTSVTISNHTAFIGASDTNDGEGAAYFYQAHSVRQQFITIIVVVVVVFIAWFCLGDL